VKSYIPSVYVADHKGIILFHNSKKCKLIASA